MDIVYFKADDYYLHYKVHTREWIVMKPGDGIYTDQPLFLVRDYRHVLDKADDEGNHSYSGVEDGFSFQGEEG